MGRIPARGVARTNVFAIRFTDEERAELASQRTERGYQHESDYMRRLIRDDAKRLAEKRAEQ